MFSKLQLLCVLLCSTYTLGFLWKTQPSASKLLLNEEDKTLDLDIDSDFILRFTLSEPVRSCVDLWFTSEPKQITDIPENRTICEKDDLNFNVTLRTTSHPGDIVIIPHSSDQDILDTSRGFALISVKLTETLNIVSSVLGWIYTIAWDFSFLPQIIHSQRRRSVAGLSFDFLTLNFLGFFSYFIFNIGLYASDSIKDQFEERNPYSISQVSLNDVIFPAYALLCVMIQIIQCIFLKKAENQRVSITCRIISSLLVLTIIIGTILVPSVESFWWIDFLYLCSYVKLTITAIKYTPQIYENYKNKSTEGWSIWQVILDFTGGTLSLVQMFLLAANYDDWLSILTNPSKLGLGSLSILFNIVFFVQHFIIYRSNNKEISKKEEMATDIEKEKPVDSSKC